MIDQAIYRVLGREQIADISASGGTGLTATQIAKPGIIYAQIQVQESDCRWRVDGGAPTASQGMYLAENGIIEVWGKQALENFLAIDDTAADALLEVIYYGGGA
ncbi:hypothetical protein LCGC14_0872980 [marine sediment metagenome]|uniref:Uncharacterized protein n=1 Tax=marine sediment metagenome TaxID=412755 RepID=A0A0F9P438_9ZZZZ